MISHDQLSRFVGSWHGPEQLSATAWTRAGAAVGSLAIAVGPDGGLLVDYDERRDAATMTGHGVLAGDGWWWFDSYGFIPDAPGTAMWDGDELRLERHSERGRTVTVLRIDGDRLEQRIDTAVPADGELVPLLRGLYSRCG